MCLALPAKVLSLDTVNQSAKVDFSGVVKTISTALVEDVSIGDYLLIHVGFALNKISPAEAEKTLMLFQEAGLVVVTESL